MDWWTMLLRNLTCGFDGEHASSRVLHRQVVFTATGRLVVWDWCNFRAFEMPPASPDEFVAIAIVAGVLVARFWKEPYKSRVVPWGTRLHDQFMLPHFVMQDIRGMLCGI